MLFKINPDKNDLNRATRVSLSQFDWDERRLQRLLFDNLEDIFSTEELLIISQSRAFKEEPDLMAVDENGDLWIFEIKAWESESENLLQALRYGQIFGQYSYDDLDELFRKFSEEQSLLDAHNRKYPEKAIIDDAFNKNQHYVIITNGLDFKTRQAIAFWRSSGLDIMPWIYRLYMEKNAIYFEFNPFRRLGDDPFEDIESDYFIVNTDRAHGKDTEREMLEEKKAAAYYSTKKTMKRIRTGDTVFLYASEVGIIAGGVAKSGFKKKDRNNDRNAEYYVDLKNFHICDEAIKPSEIREMTQVNYRFMQTCFSISEESGKALWTELLERSS